MVRNYIKKGLRVSPSEETKQKMRDAHRLRKERLGYINSPEAREKLKQKALEQFKDGYPESTKEKIRENAKINPNYGWGGKKKPRDVVMKTVKTRREKGSYKISEDAKKKMRVAKIGKTYEDLSGKEKAEEHKRKIGESNKGHPAYFVRYGKDHPNWKGGLTPLALQIRHSFEYRQWRSDVFTRDNFTCIWCGNKKSGKIEADHIKKFSVIMRENNIKTFEEALACEEFWNINNGRTLCIDCHKKTDTYGSKLNDKIEVER